MSSLKTQQPWTSRGVVGVRGVKITVNRMLFPCTSPSVQNRFQGEEEAMSIPTSRCFRKTSLEKEALHCHGDPGTVSSLGLRRHHSWSFCILRSSVVCDIFLRRDICISSCLTGKKSISNSVGFSICIWLSAAIYYTIMFF